MRSFSFALVAWVATSAWADTYRLMAATANPTTAPVVRLRWTVEDGWLPNGGFNVYRITGNGTPEKLNSTPIAPSPQMAAQPGFRLATTPIALNGTHFRNVRIARTSSGAVFAAMRDSIRTIRHGTGPAPSPSAISALLAKNPAIGRYYANLQPVVPPKPVSQEDRVRRARAHMSVAGLTNSDDARQLGLAFEDPHVELGRTITYELRPIVNGVEGKGVQAQVTVGKDPQPPTPKLDDPAQRDAHEIDLHWDPVADADEDQFGIVTYDVFRTDAKNAKPVKINASPIVVGFLPTKDGGNVPTVSTFQDKDVPIGPVTYQIVSHDSFGRDGAPATVSTTMEDWFTPPPPQAALVTQTLGKPRFYGNVLKGKGRIPDLRYGPSPDSLTIAWSTGQGPSVKPDPDALYSVYRVDNERPNDPPALLTPTPIAGNAVAPGGITLAQAVSLGVVDGIKLRHYETTRDRLLTKAEMDGTLADFISHLAGPASTDLRGDIQARLGVRSFTDPAPPRDHYYTYVVTAEYARNKHETSGTVTSVIPMPLLAAPPVPASASFSILPPSALNRPLARFDASELKGKRAFVHVVKPNVGSVVGLNWGAVAGTSTTYRVYRASVTGYFPTSQTPTPPAIKGRFKAPIAVQGRGFAYEKTRQTAPEATFALLGTATDAAYKDPVPNTHATYYRYRVTAVNRWGVESDTGATLDVRVPATLPPSVPSVIQVAPNGSGHVTVQVRPNVAEEEVEEYHVLRKQLTPQVSVSDPSSSGGGVGLNRVRMVGGRAANVGPVRKTVQFGGRSLVPTGTEAARVGSGAARFGVMSHDSPALGIGASIAKGAKGLSVDPAALKEMLDLAGYQEVGVLHLDPVQAGALAAWEDANVVPNTDYIYRIVAVNHDKISSKASMALDATPYKVNADPPPSGEARYDKERNAVSLRWAAPATGATGYVVNRAVDRGDGKLVFVQVAVLHGDNGGVAPAGYTDYNGHKGGHYVYRIDTIDAAGNFSEHTDAQGNPTGFLELRFGERGGRG